MSGRLLTWHLISHKLFSVLTVQSPRKLKSNTFRQKFCFESRNMSGKSVHEIIVGPITCFALDKQRQSKFLMLYPNLTSRSRDA